MNIPAQSAQAGDVRQDGRRIRDVVVLRDTVVLRHDDGSVDAVWPLAQLTIQRASGEDGAA